MLVPLLGSRNSFFPLLPDPTSPFSDPTPSLTQLIFSERHFSPRHGVVFPKAFLTQFEPVVFYPCSTFPLYFPSHIGPSHSPNLPTNRLQTSLLFLFSILLRTSLSVHEKRITSIPYKTTQNSLLASRFLMCASRPTNYPTISPLQNSFFSPPPRPLFYFVALSLFSLLWNWVVS